jgi:hypothetical protein
MRTFKDNAGRTWTVSVDVAAVKRARSLAGVDMLDLTGTMSRIEKDPVLVCDTLWAIVKPQADHTGIDEESFFSSLAGDCIEAAARALLAELVDFSPNHRERAALRVVLDRTWAATDKRLDLMEASLPRLVEQLEREIGTAGPTNSGDSSSGSPASSESIPVLSPSGNSA